MGIKMNLDGRLLVVESTFVFATTCRFVDNIFLSSIVDYLEKQATVQNPTTAPSES